MVNEQNNEANTELDQVEKNSEQAQSAVETSSIDANELSTQITQLTEQLQQAQEKVAQAQQQERDIALRAKAEVENIRRRAEQDIEKAHKFALEKFSNALLPVIDNLERALQAAQQQQENTPVTIEGIELTLKSLLDAVSKFGIESVEQLHVPFNPELHQAMAMHESDQVAPNHVLMVMQKGYTLNGRLLRPAMVAVSKAKS